MTRRYFNAEQSEQIGQRHDAGATLDELVAEFGGSTTSIAAALHSVGRDTQRKLRALSEDQQREAVLRYQAGGGIRPIAKDLAVRATLVSQALQSEGVVIRFSGGRHRFSDEQLQDITRKYADGASIRALAREYGCPATTIYKNLLRAGAALRPPLRPVIWTPERIESVIAAYRSGEPQKEIAARLGISEAYVRAQLRQAGVQIRGPVKKGPAHHAWNGGRRVSREGYVQVKPTDADLAYCMVNSSGYVLEHRLVAGRALGRKLTRKESVHHINGDKTDNRLENLQIRQGQHGAGVVFQCRSCGSHDIEAVPLT